MFVEVVYETGRSSVMEVANEDEAMAAMAEQHRRAKVGELAGPAGGPAERVAQAFVYDEHPDNYNKGDSLTSDELKKILPKLVEGLADDNGVVAVGGLASEVRGLSHPMKRHSEVHESNFLMEEKSKITSGDVDVLADELQQEIEKRGAPEKREGEMGP